MEYAIAILGISVILLSIRLVKEIKQKNEYLANYKKWEEEYWLLRKYASKHLDIHLSWIARGQDNCIKIKETK